MFGYTLSGIGVYNSDGYDAQRKKEVIKYCDTFSKSIIYGLEICYDRCKADVVLFGDDYIRIQ